MRHRVPSHFKWSLPVRVAWHEGRYCKKQEENRVTLGIIPTMAPTSRASHTGQSLHKCIFLQSPRLPLKSLARMFDTVHKTCSYYILLCIVIVYRESSVGIATRYGLNGPEIEFRWGARFCAPVQTGPVSHTAFYRVVTGPSAGVKRPGSGVDLLPLYGVEVKEEYSYTFTPPLGLCGLF